MKTNELDNVSDEKRIAENNWNKIKEASTKEGYREGVSKGSEEALQEGFDEGYRAAYSIGIFFGNYKGQVAAKQLDTADGSEENLRLEKTTRQIDRLEEDAMNYAKNKLRNGMAFEFETYIESVHLIAQLDKILN